MNMPTATPPTREQIKAAIVEIVNMRTEPVFQTGDLSLELNRRGLLRLDLAVVELVDELIAAGQLHRVEYVLATGLRRTLVLPANAAFS